MHTVDEMVILQLPKSALSLSLASPVGSPLTFISSLQHAPLFTKVYGTPPLPSAGVCQMSPDVGNSIGQHDVPFFLPPNKLRRSDALLCRTSLFAEHKRTPSVGCLVSVCCEHEARE